MVSLPISSDGPIRPAQIPLPRASSRADPYEQCVEQAVRDAVRSRINFGYQASFTVSLAGAPWRAFIISSAE
jgi:hypothetical protein